MFALAGLEVLEGLVFYFEPLEADDADELFAVFPDLTLSKSERHAIFLTGKNASLRTSTPGETAWEGRLFFLAGGLFAENSRLFLLCGAAGFDLFLRGFLMRGFRGSIAHITLILLC